MATSSAHTTTRLPIDEMLALATRAPSIQNTQPWLWRFAGDQLHLYADFSRQLMETDPSGRDLILSCGAALHHVQVAAEGLGWEPIVHRMPHPGDPHHLATLEFREAPGNPDAYETMLAISTRQTDRRPMEDWSVPSARLDALVAAGRAWGAEVTVADAATARKLGDLTVSAHHEQQGRSAYLVEEAARKGTTGPRPEPMALTESDRVLLISTTADDGLSRLRAGEALSAVWLRAEQDGLAAVPQSQAFEVPDTYRVVSDALLNGRACPQILMKIGWLAEDRTPAPPTERRPLEEVLVHQSPTALGRWAPGPRTGPEWRGRPV